MSNTYSIFRDTHGIPHIEAGELAGMYQGLGYAHGKDRGLQLLFMRILGQGRVSEILDSSDASLGIDLFFRRMNWNTVDGAEERTRMTPDVHRCIEAYCTGVNGALQEKAPWELRLLGYTPEPWILEDCLLLGRMTGYLTLSQSQGEMERLFIEMVQAGIADPLLHELFPGILGGFDRELVSRIQLGERIVSPPELWGRGAPRLSASNNWLVSGEMTASGKPLLSNDIHLETNRIPNVWYEVSLTSSGRHGVGFTMPGLPALLCGRTNDVSWGVTYTYMDAEDSWIERCRDESFYRNGEGWTPFRKRVETVIRKKKPPVEAVFYENGHGVADIDPLDSSAVAGADERYIRTICWTGSQTGAATMNAIHGVWKASSAREALDLLGQLEISFNWVAADCSGDIGYQMSGLMPKRRKGLQGFVPLPGWEPENDWDGTVSFEDLPRCHNPESGYIITSNQVLNHLGKVDPINVAMGPYRATRIESLLAGRTNLTAEDMRVIQRDLYSHEAAEFMEVIRPLLPETPNGDILADWDCRYDKESIGAYLFERCYRALYIEVFGKGGMGTDVVEQLFDETGIFIDFFLNFNGVLLSSASTWFGDRDRDEVYRSAIQTGLDCTPKKWGEGRKVALSHIVFGGTLPRFLGFDRGPIVMEGGRSTVRQGQIYRSAGRTTTFSPSVRFVADMAEPRIETNLAGGPSDRRFSTWYLTGLDEWDRNIMKSVDPLYDGKRLPF